MTTIDRTDTDRPEDVDALLERYMPALQAFVRLRTGPAVAARESSADVVQSVCRELLQGEGRFRYQGEAAFKGFLFTTALRKIQQKDRYHRSARRDVAREAAAEGHGDGGDLSLLDCCADLVTPSRDAAVREQVERLERAFASLTESEREIVTLARVAGLPHAEIAAQLGCSVESSRARLRRATVKLAGLLEPGG